MVTVGKLDNPSIGTIWVAASDDGLVGVSLWDEPDRFLAEVTRHTGDTPDTTTLPGPIVTQALAELESYFRGDLREFNTPIEWTILKPFQREVLEQVFAVPYGRTTSYGAIAERIGRPEAVRAVGRANATNPIPIIIPCHRILGADGKLHGYGARGGLETKAWLLRLEGSWLI